MIYGDFLLEQDLNLKHVDIILYTEAKLTSPIHFINEDKDNKEEDMEVARFNIGGKFNKTSCTIHIRNKLGGSKQNSFSKHEPSFKVVIKGLTPEDGIPVLIESTTLLEENIDPKIIKTINNKYKDILEFAKNNKDEIHDIWFIKKTDLVYDKIKEICNDEKNKKYNLNILGNYQRKETND